MEKDDEHADSGQKLGTVLSEPRNQKEDTLQEKERPFGRTNGQRTSAGQVRSGGESLSSRQNRTTKREGEEKVLWKGPMACRKRAEKKKERGGDSF